MWPEHVDFGRHVAFAAGAPDDAPRWFQVYCFSDAGVTQHLVDQALDCGYPTTPPRVIVRGVERSVLAGQRIGILGANGQGKSTLVKTIARVLPPLAPAPRLALLVASGGTAYLGWLAVFARPRLTELRALLPGRGATA